MLDKLKKELIEYGKLAGVKNFTPGFSGNLSARFGDKYLITATGSANGYLDISDLSVIDDNGNLVEGEKKPSSEKMLHVKFYQERPDINYIFHVHSPYLTSFAAAGKSMEENVLAEIAAAEQAEANGKTMKLQFTKEKESAIKQYFGKLENVKEKENGLWSCCVAYACDPQFFGWLTAMGKDVKIAKPKKLGQSYREYLKTIAKAYK